MKLIISEKRFQSLFESILSECELTTARSSGSGGQHVNKVETKVVLQWNFKDSEVIDEKIRDRLHDKLKSKISKNGTINLYHQTERSQIKNRQKLIKKFKLLLKSALEEAKKRRPTKPTKASKIENRKSKQNRSKVKEGRKKPKLDY